MSSSSSAASSRRRSRTGQARESPHSDVGLIASAGLGLLLLAGIYGGLWGISEYSFAAMFFQKSPLIFWVPPAEVFLASWALVILLLKYRKYQQQEQAFASGSELQWPERITVGETSELIAQTETLSAHPRRSFLLHRIVRLLAHFRDSRSRSEVASLLTSQSEIDVTVVESSYTMVRVFIWAIPILGFIGTVLGIGEAIVGFGDLSDLNRLQEQLAPITGGLGGAFQTTLIALALSLLIMFPTSALQRAEVRLLNVIDDFCNEQLLRRLSMRGTGSDPEDLKELADQMGATFAASLQTTIQQIVDSQNTVTSQLDALPERLANRITAALNDGLTRATQAMQQMLTGTYDSQITQVATLQQTIQAGAKMLGEVNEHAKATAEATASVSERLTALPLDIVSPLQERLSELLSRFEQNITEATETTQEAAETSARVMRQLDTLVQQLREQVQAISTDVHAWTEAARDTATTVRESQASLGACVSSLQEATEALCQLVQRVDARRELDSLQDAVARVAHILNHDSHLPSTDTPG